ncbi:Hypothetical Protein MfeM64YM_0831 [Mycoplasmopsis fermentans M64]|uniref:Uncharacterized protein n=1 Tax=Mycoplasmopsis fermentans (strain M64) TaxID=943945 RepID=A0AB32XCN7_MYCFM|nr:Hypothetical Protein MfeM64YM_0831 [Mycoplasmopsis fermentans M64]
MKKINFTFCFKINKKVFKKSRIRKINEKITIKDTKRMLYKYIFGNIFI